MESVLSNPGALRGQQEVAVTGSAWWWYWSAFRYLHKIVGQETLQATAVFPCSNGGVFVCWRKMQHYSESVIRLLQTTCFDMVTKCWEASELLRGVSGVGNRAAGNHADGLDSSDW